MPLRKSGKYMLYCGGDDCWISGIAFTSNLWNHAKNSAYAYYLALNGGTKITWNTHDWNRD